ncbi:MAG: tRNA preQ1(34) S-adenosylmethionine ribosyltransferase-isomerase QueA [Fimbriimonadaceae bacterium]|nr:tRNA preQ1(34) S-adenosylmethionine ribosyltransferase-isomerase QueA [Alphaproteobacteria bacterium]
MRVDLFDFDLPEAQIALRPVELREKCRLLTVEPDHAPPFGDHVFSDLPDLLKAGDILVLNDTRVIPARLHGVRVAARGTAQIEATLHLRLDGSRWVAFARPAKRLQVGDRIVFGGKGEACYADTLNAVVTARGEGGEVTLEVEFHGPFLDEGIAKHGEMPLPPYIASKRAPDDRDLIDYQTMFAAREGAVAAPTAGLHFTDALLKTLEDKGIETVIVTLHVGAGTFLPVKADDTDKHKMHAEWGEISPQAAKAINRARTRGGRVVAVGTTSLRLLESAADEHGEVREFSGQTDIFITPGYKFRAVDRLITNFHLPRSTLFMLVSAFSGLDIMKKAYAHAIAHDYRFYSYGDACLLTPQAGAS